MLTSFKHEYTTLPQNHVHLHTPNLTNEISHTRPGDAVRSGSWQGHLQCVFRSSASCSHFVRVCLLQIWRNGERSGQCAARLGLGFFAVQGWTRQSGRGSCVYLVNNFTILQRQTWEEKAERAIRQARAFCVALNALIDKRGFSLSVRMKHKQALQPRAGEVGEWWNEEELQVTEWCVCLWVLCVYETWGIDMLGMKLGADGQSRLVLCRSCEFWLNLAILSLMDTHRYTQSKLWQLCWTPILPT